MVKRSVRVYMYTDLALLFSMSDLVPTVLYEHSVNVFCLPIKCCCPISLTFYISFHQLQAGEK